MNKVELRVRYYHADPLGIVFFGNYLHFSADALIDVFRNYGFTNQKWLEECPGVGLPVVTSESKFHAPAVFDDLLTVELQMKELGTRSFTIYHKFMKGETLVAEIWVTRVTVGKNMKSIEIPPFLRKTLEKFPLVVN